MIFKWAQTVLCSKSFEFVLTVLIVEGLKIFTWENRWLSARQICCIVDSWIKLNFVWISWKKSSPLLIRQLAQRVLYAFITFIAKYSLTCDIDAISVFRIWSFCLLFVLCDCHQILCIICGINTHWTLY